MSQGSSDVPLNHARKHHASEPDDGADVNRNDILHVLLRAGTEILRVLVRLARVVDCRRKRSQEVRFWHASLNPEQKADRKEEGRSNAYTHRERQCQGPQSPIEASATARHHQA